MIWWEGEREGYCRHGGPTRDEYQVELVNRVELDLVSTWRDFAGRHEMDGGDTGWLDIHETIG